MFQLSGFYCKASRFRVLKGRRLGFMLQWGLALRIDPLMGVPIKYP